MIHGETKVTKFKPEAFEFVERLDAGVDIDLLSKAIISVVGDKNKRHPVIASVTRDLFRVTAIYYDHTVFFRVASVESRRIPAARDKKEYGLM